MRQTPGLLSMLACVLVFPVGACALAPLTRIDPTQGPRRDAWQKPGDVIRKLEIQPGGVVADVGAGDGYFTFLLADAVGPTGKVYAVEVDAELVRSLKAEAATRGYRNVEVVQGQYDDPQLPDHGIDLIFMCNVYHHLEDRTAYLRKLRDDLGPGGRIAIVDLKDIALVRLSGHGDHTLAPPLLEAEMRSVGLASIFQSNILPFQHFQVFKVTL